jgi:hypothetical protein
MTALTTSAVYALARNAGLDPARAVIATAIAQAESGLRTDVPGDQGLEDAKWGPSVGLWQIRSVKAESGKGTTRDATRLTDPVFNAKSMAAISGMGTNFGAWTTYESQNGKPPAYLANIPTASSAAAAVNSDPGWQANLAAALRSSVPGQLLAGVVTGVSGVVNTASTAANTISGASGWAGQATSLALKLAMVAAGLALVVVGAVRLVAPAAQGSVSSALGAGS